MTQILHKRSKTVANGNPTLPAKDELVYGEFAINYADGYETIFFKNSKNDIVSFKSQEYIDNNDLLTKGTATTSIKKKNDTSDATASGNHSVNLGYNSKVSKDYAFAEGNTTTVSGYGSHAEGWGTTASGNYGSHTEGNNTTASGDYSHAEGIGTAASGRDSHAEGDRVVAEGIASHAEGSRTTASDSGAHAEGGGTTASGKWSHAEGQGTTASGEWSHAEGQNTTASGERSHVEGYKTTANGYDSHAEGHETTASGNCSHVEGKYNVPSTLSIHCVGIGYSEKDTVIKQNAEDISYSGAKYLIGLGNYDGTNLTVTSDGTESINPDSKSVQQILNKLVEKAGGLSALFS